MVRAAVAAGAPRVDFTRRRGDVQCRWEAPVAWPLADDLERAVYTAIGQAIYQSVVVRSADWRHSVTKDGHRTAAEPHSPQTCITFALSGWRRRLFFDPSLPLARECRLCTIDVGYNGWLLNQHREYVVDLLQQWQRYDCDYEVPGVALPDTPGRALDTELICDAVVGFWRRPAQATFVVRGVPAATDWRPALPHARVVVAAPELRLDLTGLRIVEDETFREMTQTLDRWLAELGLSRP